MRFVPRTECLGHCRLLLESDLRLLLVEAQAGQGKTVLAEQFAEGADRPWAWHTCGDADTDPVLFLERLVAMFQGRIPDLPVQDIVKILHQQAPAEALLGMALGRLAEELAAAQATPLLLVLDDAHLLNPSTASLALLRDLAAAAPPAFRFTLLSRHPLVMDGKRLFPAERCLVIDNDLLAFRREEISALYNEVLGVPCSGQQVARLQEATAGWVAGLLLLRDAPREASTTLRGQDAANLDAYFSQLVAAVLDSELRQEVLLLSLLPDMPADLLEQTASPAARQWLDQMARRNVFTRVDREMGRRVVRFHHLFQDHLQRQAKRECPPEQRAATHRAAGEWRLGQGEAEAALEDFARAQDWDRLGEVLRILGPQLLVHNRQSTLLRVLGQAPGERLAADGWLSFFQGAALLAMFRPNAKESLGRALDLFRGQGDEPGELMTLGALYKLHLFVDATFGEFQGRVRRTNALFDNVRGELELPTALIIAQTLAVTSLHYIADFPATEKFLKIAREIWESQKNAEPSSEIAIASLLLHGMRGNIPAAFDELDAFHAQVNDPAMNPFTRFSFKILQANYLAMHGLAANYAESRADLQATHADALAGSYLGPFLVIWEIDLLLAAGAYAEVLALAERSLANAAIAANAHLASQFLHYQALALAHLGRNDEAPAVARRSLRVRARAGGRYYVVLNHALLGGALSLGAGAGLAERFLAKALKGSQAIGEHYTRMTSYAFRAALHLRQGREDEALADLRSLFDSLRVYGNRHFFGWSPRIMEPLLCLAAARGVHPTLARRLARERLGLDILPDGAAVPLLRVAAIGGMELRLAGAGATVTDQDLTPLQSRLLALLAASPRQSLPLERAQQELWPDQSAEASRSKFDTLLSRLRKVLADALGPEAARRHLTVKSGTVQLRHCVTDLEEVLREAREGLRLADLGRPWQAHCAFVRMAAALGAENGRGLGRPGLELPELLAPLVLEAASRWADILLAGGRPQAGLEVTAQALGLDPINDRLQRARYNLLSALKRPGEAAAALKDYRRCLDEEGFGAPEIDEIIDAVLGG